MEIDEWYFTSNSQGQSQPQSHSDEQSTSSRPDCACYFFRCCAEGCGEIKQIGVLDNYSQLNATTIKGW